MIRLVKPSKPPSANDSPLWTLQRGDRRAQAVAREVPGVGLELVITVDGELRWAQLYRGGVGLGMAAAEKREALIGCGWVDNRPHAESDEEGDPDSSRHGRQV